MKHVRNLANSKVSMSLKNKDEDEKSYYEKEHHNMGTLPDKKLPDNCISQETREFINYTLRKSKNRSAGFFHPA